MSKFYCLFNSVATDSLHVKERIISLENSCKKFNIEFCLIDEATVNFSRLPIPTESDALYNCARGSFILEKVMLNDKVKTFYRNYNYLSFQDDSNLINIELEKKGVSVPKTIYKINNDKLLLKQYVEFLGGFPVILKSYGGSGGFGVINVDNLATLNSLADYFASKKIDFQMKEFIPSNSCERLTVLGDTVIYAISRPIRQDDLRSTVYSNQVKKVTFSNEINQVAIMATHLANLNFAGVDLIISSKNKKPYILEVNCPQDIAILEKVTGENYADKMIKWIFKK